jgi:hypothetical protein
MSDSPPEGSLIRYMPGYLASGTMRGSSGREGAFEARGMGTLSRTSVAEGTGQPGMGGGGLSGIISHVARLAWAMALGVGSCARHIWH